MVAFPKFDSPARIRDKQAITKIIRCDTTNAIITRCNSRDTAIYRFNSQTYTFNSFARTRTVGGKRAGSREHGHRRERERRGGERGEEFKQSATHAHAGGREGASEGERENRKNCARQKIQSLVARACEIFIRLLAHITYTVKDPPRCVYCK